MANLRNEIAQKCYVLILAVTVAGIALRLPHLTLRPMHTDEAVHAFKFKELLEKKSYQYNPHEYHGPTLNYFTLIPAWLSSAKKLTEVNEFIFRIVPVFFGILLVLMLLLLVDGLGPASAVYAAVLTAVSPAMVFYSRYYIQEMLLVCLAFGVIVCGYRYVRNKSIGWVLLAGMFAGLMHATKETCVIAFGSMLLALCFTLMILSRRNKVSFKGIIKTMKTWHLIAAVAVAAMVSILFYSSFFTSPEGILESLRTYTSYLGRASRNQLHIHPWYYYLKMLIYSRYATGPVWSEALIIFFAVTGFIVAVTRKGLADANFDLLTFIAFYTAIMTVLYSIIPYKTPWCMLGFLHGMILLAGVGVMTIIKLAPNIFMRALISLLLIAGVANLAWQAYLGSYKYYAVPANPYVYAQTSMDIYSIVQRLEDVAQAHPEGHNMPVDVICSGDDYWPLPWYLRAFTAVAWRNEVNYDAAAPVIIASPDMNTALMKKLYELPPPGQKNLYVPLFDSYMELRPHVELIGLVTKDLWDRFQQHQIQPKKLQIGR